VKPVEESQAAIHAQTGFRSEFIELPDFTARDSSGHETLPKVKAGAVLKLDRRRLLQASP